MGRVRYDVYGNQRAESGRVSREIKEKIFILVAERDNYRCQACGITTDYTDKEFLGFDDLGRAKLRLGGNYPTLDHIIPAFHGGTFTTDNLRLFCNDCNYNHGEMFRHYILYGYENRKSLAEVTEEPQS